MHWRCRDGAGSETEGKITFWTVEYTDPRKTVQRIAHMGKKTLAVSEASREHFGNSEHGRTCSERQNNYVCTSHDGAVSARKGGRSNPDLSRVDRSSGQAATGVQRHHWADRPQYRQGHGNRSVGDRSRHEGRRDQWLSSDATEQNRL